MKKLHFIKTTAFALTLTLASLGSSVNASTAGSIRVNNNALYTTSSSVKLSLSAPDGGATAMKLSNNGYEWTGWKPVTSSYSWNISNYTGGSLSEGTKKVYVVYNDGLGNESPKNVDSITYNPRLVTAVTVASFKYDPSGTDGTNYNGEYVVLKNNLKGTLNLTSWTVRDRYNNHTYTFPSFVLGAGKTVALFTGPGPDKSSLVHWNLESFVWNNDGDTLQLHSVDGNLALTKSY